MLAILAGVGAVAYRGYIKKAREAADLELLSAVNTAFQAACMDEGMKTYPGPGEAVAQLSGKTGSKTMGSVTADGKKLASFEKYYKGNEEKQFKVYNKLSYLGDGTFAGVGLNGTIYLDGDAIISFRDNGDGTQTYTYKNGDKEYSYIVSTELLDYYSNSTFAKNMKASDLLDKVDAFSYIAGKGLANDNYKWAFGPFKDELVAKGYISADEKDAEVLSNAAVLAVAQKTMDNRQSLADLANTWGTQKYSQSFDLSDMNGTVANVSLAYALATSFANSEYGKKDYKDGQTFAQYFEAQNKAIINEKSGLKQLTSTQSLLSAMLGSEGFREYYAACGVNDVNGYLSTMQFINDNEQSLLDNNNVVKNKAGFSDDELGTIVDSILN